VLSDHAGEQLQASEQQLNDAAANHAAWQDYYARTNGELDAARRSKPLWRRVLSISTPDERTAQQRAEDARNNVERAEYGVQQAYTQVQQRGAGVYGEELLAWHLSGLPDEWTLLHGYRNRRGETDHVLVGPAGIWAIEVKRRRGLLHAVGDRWWLQRTSTQGHVYESEWAVDGGGRNWSRQVGEIAQDLSAWLTRQGHPVPVRTAVMLMHEQAQLAECTDPGVDFVGTDTRQLLDAIMRRYATPLTTDACENIVRLVERDHNYHARRRRQRHT
jgi:hypothetical protein